MLLRCLKITDKNKLMMSMTQIRKRIHSLPTERVLHNPAGLFVHLCGWTCDGK